MKIQQIEVCSYVRGTGKRGYLLRNAVFGEPNIPTEKPFDVKVFDSQKEAIEHGKQLGYVNIIKEKQK